MFVVGSTNIKIKKIKNEPIGKLVRPIKLYKGYVFPTNSQENFSFWFTQTKKTECLFQTQKDSVAVYKCFLGDFSKNLMNQYKELEFGNLNKHDSNFIINGYCGVVTGFIYYFNKEYHICRSEKEQNAIIKKSKKNSNINISFLTVKLYKKIDLGNKKGLDEWSYHSSESFELIFSVDEVILLDRIIEIEKILAGNSIKTKRGEHIVLSVQRKEKTPNISISSLSDLYVKILTKNNLRELKLNIQFDIID